MKQRDILRSKLLGAFPVFKTKIVKDDDGTEYELRQPSIEGRAAIRKASTRRDEATGDISFEPFEFTLRAAIACTYVPGTDEKVFEDTDWDVLIKSPAGGLVDELSQAAAELCNVEAKAVKKPSAETTKDS